MALEQIEDTRAVAPLVAALGNDRSSVRRKAARLLGGLKDARAVEALKAALSDKRRSVRMTAAWSLGEMDDPKAAEALAAAMKQKNLEIVAGAYGFFIRAGISGSESVLTEALNRHGTPDMARDFIHSANSRLEEAGHSWAIRHGYRPAVRPTTPSSPKWGGGR